MFEKIFKAWQEELKSSMESDPLMIKLKSGSLDIRHYKGYLLETYHHAGLNPQIQAYTTMFFKNNPRKIIQLFYKHAISEISHDLLAMSDLEVLGEDPKKLTQTQPLPSTIALNAFPLYLIQFKSPVSYLGYLFHLEFLPTQNGSSYIEVLSKMGVPSDALKFLQEHSTVDVGHNKMMETYVQELVKTEEDLNDVIYAAKCTCNLHTKMIADAIKNGERYF